MFEESLLESLKTRYSDEGEERVGCISGGEIIEWKNVHPEPTGYFEVSFEDTIALEEDEKAEAIWHTQPGQTSQLSYEDSMGFFAFPHLKHIVIGSDGIRIYKVEGNAVIKDSLHLR